MTTFVLAGGCFWCLDAVYRTLEKTAADRYPDLRALIEALGETGYMLGVSLAAAVVLGLRTEGVLVEDVETTAKTFPGFAQAWSGLF